jgi:hypothetical protein
MPGGGNWSMRELPQSLFDVYALALPRGHGFGKRPPIGAWRSGDDLACGVVTRGVDDGRAGALVMRRLQDHVWMVTLQQDEFPSAAEARAMMELAMKEGAPPESIPANTQRRPALYNLQGREPSAVFKLLTQPTHHIAAWLLNQVYLALPNPDRSWAGDCQTGNFHTRLWEAHLLASFREQGLVVAQPYSSPDFHIQNCGGSEAWIEAVTANPPVPYDHVNSRPTEPPEDVRERFLGPAAVRFAKTLGSKLQRRYDRLAHVSGKPFAIALADFHAPASMTWSREALVGYLFGMHAETAEVGGRVIAVSSRSSHLLGESAFPAGLFRNADHGELSAVVFTNACAISKFNRVGVSAGALAKGLRYVRLGKFYDRTPGALDGIPFCLDVTSDEYRRLWPQGYEPWSAELEVFHNPFAQYPLPHALVPEATHWFEVEGEIVCEAHYETSVLWSKTLIQSDSDPMPTLGDDLTARKS